MKDKVLSFIQKHHMLSPGDHVICALSGGRDSVALLHVLLELRRPLAIDVSAAHVNHQLRGMEARRDEEFVVSHCAALGVPLYSARRDVAAYAKAHHLGLEVAARELRYEYLLSLSKTAKIATAHTADDNLETLLIHLVRGCGLSGMTGIPPVRGRIIRPLLLTEHCEIDGYLQGHQIPHVEDSTNNEDFCLRNRLRHQVIPLLKNENSAIALSSSQLCLQLTQEEAYLTAEAEKQLTASRLNAGLSVSVLRTLPEAIALRVLRLYLKPVPELGRIHLTDAYGLCLGSSPSARLSLPGNWTLRREYDLLVLDKPTDSQCPSPVILYPGESCVFGDFQVNCTRCICPKALSDSTIALKLPQDGFVTLRPRQAGDSLTLSGGTKKLSRYMIDQKIPVSIRNKLPVVLCQNTPAALLPLATDKKFRVSPGEDSLILSVKRLEEVK